MDLVDMFGDCIEWAEWTCDKEASIDEFFEMLDLPITGFAVGAMLKQLKERGFFEEVYPHGKT